MLTFSISLTFQLRQKHIYHNVWILIKISHFWSVLLFQFSIINPSRFLLKCSWNISLEKKVGGHNQWHFSLVKPNLMISNRTAWYCIIVSLTIENSIFFLGLVLPRKTQLNNSKIYPLIILDKIITRISRVWLSEC